MLFGPVRAEMVFLPLPWVSPTATHGLVLRGSQPAGLVPGNGRQEDACKVQEDGEQGRGVPIPTEPTGSIPRPAQLIEAIKDFQEGRLGREKLTADNFRRGYRSD